MSDGPVPETEVLFEGAACGLLLSTQDGTISRVNQTFCRWTGFESAELVGRRRIQDLLTMGGRIFHQTHWVPLLQMQGSIAEVKVDITHRDGHSIPMVMNVLRRKHEATTYDETAIFVAEDRHKYERELIAARRRAEVSLAKEKEAVLFAEQMVGIVSHDLRNPLSAIQMGAHVLGRGELSSNQMRLVGNITNSTIRAVRLIETLLDFTRARVGSGIEVILKPIDLHQLISDGVDELSLAFQDRTFTHIQNGDGLCVADADRLVQMLGNLVANAVSYGASDQTVTVTSRVEANEAVIEVHNFGPQIPDDLKAHLFEPMMRGKTSGGANAGVGLGLFIVRAIARAHRGDVFVDSSIAGGTTFSARFPADLKR